MWSGSWIICELASDRPAFCLEKVCSITLEEALDSESLGSVAIASSLEVGEGPPFTSLGWDLESRF